jgi:hypothetical protein
MEFVPFKTFYDDEQFTDFIQILKTNSIIYQTESYNSTIDPATIQSIRKHSIVKIQSEDFIKVNQILAEIAKKQVEFADKDHYLFSFSDLELREILVKPDEWTAFDVELAKKILNERGEDISDTFIENLQNARIESLTNKKESMNVVFLILGYILALLGGLLGIGMGWYLLNHSKILPNGEKVYIFNDSNRQNGRIMMYIGIVSFIISMTIKMMDLGN